jgi:hypothetical protein
MRALLLSCFVLSAACHDLEPPEPPPRYSSQAAPRAIELPHAEVIPALRTAVETPAPVEAGSEQERAVRKPTEWQGDDSVPGARRAEVALENRKAVVEALFDEAGVTFPPAQVFLRVFKKEGELEAWASSEKGGEMKRIATYQICKISGDIGPKRREGDMQVPEGFYRIEYFWPDSAFYLAGKVSYPNGLDRQLGGPAPGGEIMLHGGCASIGCISMSDERMEELYVMGTSVYFKGEPVNIHIFPTRDMRALLDSGEHAEHHAFWENLADGLESFERDHRVPVVRIGFQGKYEFRGG